MRPRRSSCDCCLTPPMPGSRCTSTSHPSQQTTARRQGSPRIVPVIGLAGINWIEPLTTFVAGLERAEFGFEFELIEDCVRNTEKCGHELTLDGLAAVSSMRGRAYCVATASEAAEEEPDERCTTRSGDDPCGHTPSVPDHPVGLRAQIRGQLRERSGRAARTGAPAQRPGRAGTAPAPAGHREEQ